jgi:hypothetical protein
MMRRTGVLLATALLVSSAAVVSSASMTRAAISPTTGNVACEFDGASTYTPYLGYGPGIGDPRIGPNRDSKWKLLGNLAACTGTQSGGNPKLGPIATGEVLMKATAVDHDCQKVTDHGLAITRLRVKWKDALGRNLRTSIGTGSVTVDGLTNGSPYLDFFTNPVPNPDYVAPGIINVQATGTIGATSKAFPGQTFTFTGTVDQTIADDMPGPCSYIGPPARQGVSGFGFHGEHGPSSLSVS